MATLLLVFSQQPPQESVAVTPEQCFAGYINEERSARGIFKLIWDSDLASTSEEHSEKMAADETIYHSRSSVPAGYSAWGENVGMGPSCDSLHDAFMDSEKHKSNILDKDFTLLGVGVVERGGLFYVTEQFADKVDPKPVPKPKPKPPAPKPPAPKCTCPG